EPEQQLAYEDLEQIEKLDLEEMDLKWNLLGSTSKRSDATSVNKEAILPGNAGQRESSTSNDSESVTNDFISCDDSDKSTEDNTSNFASCDSSGKSSEHKPTEIESNVGTPITEPISVKDLPSFTCNKTNGKFDCWYWVGHAVRAQPIPTGRPKDKPVPTGRPKVNLVPTTKPKIRSVPTGKPQVTSPVPAGRLNRPFLVPTGRGYSPS
nr:hypothetical protein [Tanacetum cinerariifolium]